MEARRRVLLIGRYTLPFPSERTVAEFTKLQNVVCGIMDLPPYLCILTRRFVAKVRYFAIGWAVLYVPVRV